MQVVVETGDYLLKNMSDISMLQVAVNRLNGLWPDAVIQIITKNPVRLMNYCPGAIPLSLKGRKKCLRGRHLISRLRMKLPQVVSRRLDEAEFSAKYRHPDLFWSIVDLKNRVRGIRMSEDIESFRDSILGMAANLGKHTAMFGQGIGPVQDPELFQVCSDVLSKRKDRRGKGLVQLTRIQIYISEDHPESVLVTGRPALFLFYFNTIQPGMICTFTIYNQNAHAVANFHSTAHGPGDSYDSASELRMLCKIDELLLVPGRYRINVAVAVRTEMHDHVEAAAFFDVEGGDVRGRQVPCGNRFGNIYLPHHWILPNEMRRSVQ